MEISNNYKNNIEMMFGDIGKEWLQTIPNKIEKYVKLFNLKNIKLLNELTYNVLISGESSDFGPVVLKFEIPFKELTIRESTALKLNDGKGACKCYYSNIDDGVILIERLQPGRTLNSVNDLEDRIKIFNEVSTKFNIQIGENTGLPSYREILDRSINLAIEQEQKFLPVNELLQIANSVYEDLRVNNESNYLLHSDLFCDNILETNEGWKAIDPHGFVGEKILDTAIFMQKELEKKEFSENDVEILLNIMGKNINLDENDLLKALFVNYVLNICWNIEVNLDNKYISKSVDKVTELLQMLNNKNLIVNKEKKLKHIKKK
ncbi:MAG: aminoglycoside phosphotransferase family protein [Bacilli bacterium]